MKRTGWIPASKPPVRTGWYEWRCTAAGFRIIRAEWMGDDWAAQPLPTDRPRPDCLGCEWRGLTKPAKEAK